MSALRQRLARLERKSDRDDDLILTTAIPDEMVEQLAALYGKPADEICAESTPRLWPRGWAEPRATPALIEQIKQAFGRVPRPAP